MPITDEENLARMLDGEVFAARGPTLSVYQYGVGPYMTALSHGGFMLLSAMKDGSFFLDLDQALWAVEHTEELRQFILHYADKHNIKLIPAGMAALGRGLNRELNGTTTFSPFVLNPKYVHRVGREGVFMLDHSYGQLYYLSGYDRQEEPPLYFLCRLPHPVETVSEAYESLKPKSVRIAEANGIQVRRQGDLFFIESSVTIPADDMHRVRIGERMTTGLYGTNHVATLQVQTAEGAWLASGKVLHEPMRLSAEARPPDHHPLILGDPWGSWWWVIKNTVPILGPSSARRVLRW